MKSKSLNLKTVMLMILTAGASLLAPSIALPASASGAQCKSVLKPMDENQRQEMVANLIDKGVVLSVFQMEAVVQVATKEGLAGELSSQAGEFGKMQNKKPLKDLQTSLSSTDPNSAPLRRDFAEKVLNYMETAIFPSKIANSNPRDRYAGHKQAIDEFYIRGLAVPSAERMDIAWDYFHHVIKTPQGRELLINTILNSNGAVARQAYLGQRDPGFGTFKAITGGMGLMMGVPYALSMALETFAHGTAIGSGLGATAVTAGILAGTIAPVVWSSLKRPQVAARLRIMRAVEGRRLKKLMFNQTEEVSLVAAPLKVTQPVLTETFKREILTTHSEQLGKMRSELASNDFATVAKFGKEMIPRADQAMDLMGLMSERVALLEKEIDQIDAENAAEASERILLKSSEILQDSNLLKNYLELLDKKLIEHIKVGHASLEAGKLNEMAAGEMGDVLQELVSAQSVLESSMKVIPMTIQVAQAQRTILRDLRSNMLATRVSQSARLAKLTEATAKLKAIKAAGIDSIASSLNEEKL